MQERKWWTRELGSQVEKSGDPGHLCQDEESGFYAKGDGCPWKIGFKKWNDVTCFQRINLAAMWKIGSRVKMSESRERMGSGWDQAWRWSWQILVIDWLWGGKEQIGMTHRSWDWAAGWVMVLLRRLLFSCHHFPDSGMAHRPCLHVFTQMSPSHPSLPQPALNHSASPFPLTLYFPL